MFIRHQNIHICVYSVKAGDYKKYTSSACKKSTHSILWLFLNIRSIQDFFFEYLEVTAIQKQDLRVVKAWRLVHKRV